MKLSRLESLNLALPFLLGLFSLTVYSSLPDSIPTHWNIHGIADGYLPKAIGVSVMPGVALLLSLLFIAVRTRVPDEGRAAMERISTAVLSFLVATGAMILLVGLGYPIPVLHTIIGGMGALFLLLGFWLAKMPRNLVVGFRLPWTLKDEHVWKKTHELGSKVFVIGGTVMFLSAAIGWPALGALIAIPAIVIIPIVYSWRIAYPS